MSESEPASDLTAHLGFWLRMVSNSVSHAFAAKVAGEGVTVAEWAVMRSLYGRDPMPPSRLADHMGMTRGAITKLADRLIAKGLLTRAANAEDGRAQILGLTTAAQTLVPVLAALADQNDVEFFGALTPAEREALVAILKRIAERSRITALPIT